MRRHRRHLGHGPFGRRFQGRFPPWPVARYVRARLHRRLFVWFGATILFTGIVVAGVMFAVTGGWGSQWHRDVQRVEKFTAGRFAHVWASPAERDELAASMAEELDLAIRLEDADGKPLGTFGHPCNGHEYAVAVDSGGRHAGNAVVCFDRGRGGGGIRMIVPLLVAGFILWAATGKIARRLARPLAEVARVADEIGRGRLESRAHPECRTPDEVGVIADAVNDMATRIERQLQDQRMLLAAVSHELRTPLGHLRIISEMIRGGGADQKMVDELEREIVEIDTLVGELLASSRLDFTALTPKPLDALDVAHRALERAGVAHDKLVVEHGDASETAISLEADPTLLGRALANLIDNAQKHGGGLIALRVQASPDRVRFEVDDSGEGVAEGEESSVFEPFYRSRSGSASKNGTLGLGLSLVKRIAEAHGGTAYAGRRPEGGARIGFDVSRKIPEPS